MSAGSKGLVRHPLFPAFVTLWFGALFGLGSLAIAQPALEYLVSASGLPGVLPAAAPPLGAKARVIVALAACGFGAILGLVISALLLRKSNHDDGQDEEIYSNEWIGSEEHLAEDVQDEQDPFLEPAVDANRQETGVEPENLPLEDAGQETDSFVLDEAGDNHAPRAPFSVFDELGEPGIAAEAVNAATVDGSGLVHSEPLEPGLSAPQSGPEPDQDGQKEISPVVLHPIDSASLGIEPEETEPEEEFEVSAEEVAAPPPPFAGSPPLPSNVHAIDAARLAQRGLPTSFADAVSSPEPQAEAVPALERTEETLPVEGEIAPDGQTETALRELSYLQLTERLAQAISRNPTPPAVMRAKPPHGLPPGGGGARQEAASPGLERLRRNHSASPAANERGRPSSGDIRDALAGLRNTGSAG